MFATLSRSWEFAKISYGIIWDFKKLLVFPIVSSVTTLVVLASFLTPLWMTGTLESWMASESAPGGQSAGQAPEQGPIAWAVLTFLFYFVTYTIIVFFNVGLLACAFQVIGGEPPTIGHGMRVAWLRMPQILGWAFISALVGTILRSIENSNEKAGALISGLLGSAWTALTYFVLPVLAIEGKGPIGAFKSAMGTLKETWGTALVGNFSMGVLAFLVTLPVIVVFGGLGFMAHQSGSVAMLVLVIGMGVMALGIVAAFTSAADVVFKAVLYNFATGRALPEGVDRSELEQAFKSKH